MGTEVIIAMDRKIEVEQIRMSNILIKDLFKENFIKKIENAKIDIIPINVVFVPKKGEPLILSHQNSQEIKESTLHITCRDTTTLKKFEEILKGINKK